MIKKLFAYLFVAVVFFTFGWIGRAQYELAREVSHDRSGQILFSYTEQFDPRKTAILSVKLVQETVKSLILEVDYNFAEESTGKSQIFVLPDIPYWTQRPALVLRGRNTATVVVELNSSEMEKKQTVKAVSTYLNASIERYTESQYLGVVTSRQIPFKKVWSLGA